MGSRRLKHIVEMLLREADEEQPVRGEDSIDNQIDKYFSSYESEAKNSKNEGLNFRDMTRRFLIEAGEDEEKEDESAEDEESEPEKLTAEDIDVGSFANDVVRLVENYDNLLEMRNTILRRAMNYLSKNYDSDVIDLFREELLEGHGMEIGVSNKDEEEKFLAPKAAAAGPAGGGGSA